jgi:hypothetical protein
MRHGDIYSGGYNLEPESNRTINFNNTMSVSEMQAEIDAIGKYLPWGNHVTIQFADGTYTMDRLNVRGFYGGGSIRFRGNSGEGSNLYTSQAVFLDFSVAASYCFYLSSNLCNINFYNLKIRHGSTYSCIFYAQGQGGSVNYCYLLGTTGTRDGYGVQTWVGTNFVEVEKTYFEDHYAGIRCEGARVWSTGNDDTGTLPHYGLQCGHAGVIGKTSTQPSGNNADEATWDGGEIR